MVAHPQHAMSSTQQRQTADEMPTAAGAEPEESASEESDDDNEQDPGAYAKGIDAAITRSAVAFTGFSKIRLSELIEFIHDPFDSTVTASF